MLSLSGTGQRRNLRQVGMIDGDGDAGEDVRGVERKGSKGMELGCDGRGGGDGRIGGFAAVDRRVETGRVDVGGRLGAGSGWGVVGGRKSGVADRVRCAAGP